MTAPVIRLIVDGGGRCYFRRIIVVVRALHGRHGLSYGAQLCSGLQSHIIAVTSRCSTVHDCLYAMPDAATPVLPAFFACRPCYVLFLRPRRGSAEYCDERVCLCVFVCLSAIISPKLYVRSSPICACFLWPWLGPALKLRISGFMNDVIFAHKLIGCSTSPPGWGSEAHTYADLSLVRRNTRCRQRTLGTTSCSQGLLGRSGRVEYLWHHACT